LNRLATILRWSRWPAFAALALFAVSELLTDRVQAMQWAWWIPRPLLAGCTLAWLVVLELAALAARVDRRELRANRWAVAAAAACTGYALLGVWRPDSPRPADAVRLVHWNASYVESTAVAPSLATLLLELDADVVVVTDPGLLWWGDGVQRFTAAGYELRTAGRFCIASRIGIVEARPVLAQGRLHATRIEVDTRFGPLAIEAIDLPSDPWRSRWQTVVTVSGALAAQRSNGGATSAQRGGLPDVIVGDFNITRGSASLRGFGEGYAEAFAAAGSGWGGTYPRAMALWAIDLALVGRRWSPARSEIIDPGAKRHRLQVVDLVPKDLVPKDLVPKELVPKDLVPRRD
jgi:hypothetical protein